MSSDSSMRGFQKKAGSAGEQRFQVRHPSNLNSAISPTNEALSDISQKGYIQSSNVLRQQLSRIQNSDSMPSSSKSASENYSSNYRNNKNSIKRMSANTGTVKSSIN